MSKIIDELKAISQLNGVSGHETLVAQYVYQQAKKITNDVTKDNLGSVIARIGDKKPRVMIAGHLDEVGLLVTQITNDGFIKFQTLGGWYSQVMLAQTWRIITKNGVVYGVTGAKPPHIIPLSDRSKAVDIKSMYIDIGVKDKQEALALGVSVGDFIVPDTDFKILGNKKYLLSKAWDNRIGSYIVLKVLEELSKHKIETSVFGTFTVMEEVGLRGAKTSSYLVKPDIAIAIDTGLANDVPGGDSQDKSLGLGPQIIVYDSGLIAHRGLREYMIKIAKDNNISFQEGYTEGGSTDAGQMHLAHSGAASIVVNIPTRYMHSHTSIIHLDDVLNTIKLLTLFIKSLDEQTVNNIINY